MLIELTEKTSKVVLLLVFLLEPILLTFGRKCWQNRSKVLGIILYVMGIGILLIPMGFRTKGIDHNVYFAWYTYPEYLLNPYDGSPEPLYLLLNLFAKHILNSFQFIYFMAAFVFILGSRIYVIKKADDIFFATFFLNFSLFIYMCGLVRISIALGIVYYALCHINNRKKFFGLIIIAILFHYSACIGFLIYNVYQRKKSFAFRDVVLLLSPLLIISFLFERFGSLLPFSIQRYLIYTEMKFDISSISNIAVLIPAFIIFLFFKDFWEREISNYKGVKNTIVLLMIVCLISLCYKGVFRFTFYFYPTIACIYGMIPRIIIMNNGNRAFCFIIKILFIILGVLTVDEMFFNSPYITELVIPFTINVGF